MGSTYYRSHSREKMADAPEIGVYILEAHIHPPSKELCLSIKPITNEFREITIISPAPYRRNFQGTGAALMNEEEGNIGA